MRNLLGLGLLLAGLSSPVRAQTDLSVRAGITGWGVLIHDFIAEDVDTRPSLGPMVSIGIGHPIAPRYGAGLELSVGTNNLHTDYGTTRNDLGTVRTASAVALLDGLVSSGLHWRAGLGALHYFSDSHAPFLTNGATRLLFVAGLDLRRPLLTSWDIMLAARYDFHRFTTAQLEAFGFSQSQGVQRVSVSVGLARRHR